VVARLEQWIHGHGFKSRHLELKIWGLRTIASIGRGQKSQAPWTSWWRSPGWSFLSPFFGSLAGQSRDGVADDVDDHDDVAQPEQDPDDQPW